jgi:nucleoside diphosphate kinase
VSATKLDTYCDQTVVVVVPAFAFETLSSAHFNAIGKRVGTPTVPPVVPILSVLLQHGPDSVLSALLEANPLKSRGLGTVEANISGGFAAIAAKTVARASEALKHVILSAVGKALVPEWSSHLQGPVVVLVLRRLDARRKVRSILGLDRDDGSKNALQDLLQSKYGLDLPSVAAVITSAVKVGDVLFKCFDVSELHQPQGFPASVDSLSLPGERLGYGALTGCYLRLGRQLKECRFYCYVCLGSSVRLGNRWST